MLRLAKMSAKILAFFDFDFTLAMTSECVHVWSPRGTRTKDGKKYISVNPTEYNVLKLANDEKIDDLSFDEFSKIDLNNAKPIEPVLNYMRFILCERQNVVRIVSARPQDVEPYVEKFLKLQDIDANSKIRFKGCSSSDPSLKYKYLKEQVIIHKPQKIYFFDDSEKVMKYVANNARSDYNKEIEFVFCLIASSLNEKKLVFKTL